MNACIENNNGYIVKVWVTTQLTGDVYSPECGHFASVVKFESQSDAIEFRNLLLKDGINENRVKLFIKNYDGKPRMIVLGRHDFKGEPILRRIRDYEQ